MSEYIKKASQAGGSKSKETYIAHKRFREDKKEDKEEKKESKYLKKKDKKEDKKEYIKKKEKKEDKKEYIKKIERVDANTGGLMSGFPKLAKKGWK